MMLVEEEYFSLVSAYSCCILRSCCAGRATRGEACSTNKREMTELAEEGARLETRCSKENHLRVRIPILPDYPRPLEAAFIRVLPRSYAEVWRLN